jgi:hypothetical protein
MKLFITLCTSCESCGAHVAVRVTTVAPTKEQQDDVSATLGGMWCIRTHVVEAEVDGDANTAEVE